MAADAYNVAVIASVSRGKGRLCRISNENCDGGTQARARVSVFLVSLLLRHGLKIDQL